MKKKITLLLLLIIIIVVAILWWRERPYYGGEIQKVSASPEQIEHGKYIAISGDCASCHTAENGAPMAGGYPIKTVFGTMYSSNITPSPDHGIGRWTNNEFYDAITKGIAPNGRHLYPSMPYTSYKGITREDSDALYAYLMTRMPVDVSPPENEMPFPFNQRMLMIGWNMLFDSSKPMPASSKGQSVEWERGRYLVNVLAHCGECHTPRGTFGQLDNDKIMQGSMVGTFYSPNITPEGLSNHGWTREDLISFFRTGFAPQGSAFSEMNTVINNSTYHMSEDDVQSIVTYLMGDEPLPPVPVKSSEGNASGRDVYLEMCSACHGLSGQGIPNVAISMQNNSTLRHLDGTNLILSILNGIPGEAFPNNQYMQPMPAFSNRLSDKEISDLANYLRQTWGGIAGDITEQKVKELRK